MVTIKLSDSNAKALMDTLIWLAPVISHARTLDNDLIQSPEVDLQVSYLLEECDNQNLCAIRYVRDELLSNLTK